MKKFNLETKVGLFFFVVFVLIAWISMKLQNCDLGETSGYVLQAVFPSAAGLNPESPVLMAGLRIGKIDDIRLDKGKALVVMTIRGNATVPFDSGISIQSKGFLGAKFLEILPGSDEKTFSDGDRFQNVSGGGDFGAVTADLEDIAKDIKAITANLREIFGTPEGEQGIMEVFENVQRVSTFLGDAMETNQKNFNLLVSNLQRFSSNLAYLSDKNRQDISNTMAVFPAIAGNLKVITENLAVILAENNQDIGESMRNLSAATERLEKAMDSIASISRKIDEGEGTIGKLVNEDETADDLNEAVNGINEFIGRVRRIQTEIAYRGEYDIKDGDIRSYFNVKIQPSPDKFYLLGVLDDPSGRTRISDTHTETTYNKGEADEETETEDEHKEITTEDLLFNVQLGKRWHDLVLRGGLIESKGGVGLEYNFWEDHINFQFEAFDFGSDSNPHLKTSANFFFLKHFTLTAGIDDFIHKYDDPRYYFGAGIRITDDDLSLLFSQMPSAGGM